VTSAILKPYQEARYKSYSQIIDIGRVDVSIIRLSKISYLVLRQSLGRHIVFDMSVLLSSDKTLTVATTFEWYSMM
jgi:hypothetical protein